MVEMTLLAQSPLILTLVPNLAVLLIPSPATTHNLTPIQSLSPIPVITPHKPILILIPQSLTPILIPQSLTPIPIPQRTPR